MTSKFIRQKLLLESLFPMDPAVTLMINIAKYSELPIGTYTQITKTVSWETRAINMIFY